MPCTLFHISIMRFNKLNFISLSSFVVMQLRTVVCSGNVRDVMDLVSLHANIIHKVDEVSSTTNDILRYYKHEHFGLYLNKFRWRWLSMKSRYTPAIVVIIIWCFVLQEGASLLHTACKLGYTQVANVLLNANNSISLADKVITAQY